MPAIKFTLGLMCDDVRREITGKDILIGVYSSNIIILNFPSALNIALWMQFHADEAGSTLVEIRVVDQENRQILHMGANFEIQNAGSGSFFTPPTAVLIEAPGSISLQARQADGEWTNLASLPVLAPPEGYNPFFQTNAAPPPPGRG